MTLSSRWAERHHRALSHSTEDAVRLAIALGAVRSVVRVVDRSMPPMTVDWAAHDPEAAIKSMSYTDFQGGHIRINPSPILDKGLDHGVALDVSAGFGLHEASHSQESRDRYKYLIKTAPHPNGKGTWEVPAFNPMRVAAYLWNMVEDVRIEKATSRHWPGFAPYFERVLDYMWSEMRRAHELPLLYGPTLAEKLRVAYLACRYPGKVDMAYPDEIANEPIRSEIAWWQAWQHDYLTDAVDTPTTIQRGLDHLAQDPATKDELTQMTLDERREREAGERLRAQIERLIREGVSGTFEVCTIENGEIVPLPEEVAQEVDKLVREHLVEHRVTVTHSGVSVPTVRVRKPEESKASRRAYIGRPSAMVEALRAALVFRAATPEHSEKLLRSGSIDDEELWRLATDDRRVFGQRVIESKPDVFMGLLADVSGSMYGHKLGIVQRLAQLLVWAVHDQEGIETAVWAHTADVNEHGTVDVFRVWERGDPMSRLGIISDLPNANNGDGWAIETVVTAMLKAEQPQKVLVVLADGLPNAHGYGDAPARRHIRQVVRWAEARGVKVIQLAIDPHDLRPQQQSEMFGEGGWIPYLSDAALPRQLTRLIERYLS